jgi:hypothetical protein
MPLTSISEPQPTLDEDNRVVTVFAMFRFFAENIFADFVNFLKK